MKTAVVLLTRDLRLHDNPALAAAYREADEVTVLFVRDPAIRASPRRLALLDEILGELDGIDVRRGDPVEEVGKLEPDAVYCSEDASPYAQRRERRLAERFDLRLYPGTTVVPFGDIKTYRVFTPYFRVWREQPRRAVEDPPEGATETVARRRFAAWLAGGTDGGSRLSPYFHFGCLSPLEATVRAAAREEFVRQLCWRDFYAQLLRAEPARFALGAPGGEDERFAAWRDGRTGKALVDAGMQQLAVEGWLPNRVRMVAASYLVHGLGVDWRLGAAHFERYLLDADIASNRGNWLWIVANTRRVFNPDLQAKRMADYVERWAPRIPRTA